MTDEEAIQAANTAFYKAFSNGDVLAMARVWADEDTVSCIHPGWPAIVGRDNVIGSWKDILQVPNRPAIICHEPHVIIVGNDARVLCIELFGSMALAASNHFRLIDGAWRLTHHQSSQIANVVDQTSNDPHTQPRIVH